MNNIKRIRNQLKKYDCNAILITSPVNRFYATGFNSSAGALLVTTNGAWFFTDFRYIEMAQSAVSEAQVLLATDENTYSKQIKAILDEKDIAVLGVEDDRLTYAQYREWKKKLKKKFVSAGELIDELRAVKSAHDHGKITKAQRIAEKSFEEILPLISTDITEKQLATELVYRLVKNGADDKAFDPIVVSGTKSSMPHGVPDNSKISHGFLTIDFGARFDGWCSDMTRTVCVGQPTEEMINVYKTVLKAQKVGIGAIHAGAKCVDVDAAARNVIKDAGFGEFFGHGLGHSIGLEVHENPKASPISKETLPEGAVLTVEPGIYLPGRFGVRIEDMVFVTKEGCKNITKTKRKLIIL